MVAMVTGVSHSRKLLKTRWDNYHEKAKKKEDGLQTDGQIPLKRKRSTLTRSFKWSNRTTMQVVSINENEDVEL